MKIIRGKTMKSIWELEEDLWKEYHYEGYSNDLKLQLDRLPQNIIRNSVIDIIRDSDWYFDGYFCHYGLTIFGVQPRVGKSLYLPLTQDDMYILITHLSCDEFLCMID